MNYLLWLIATVTTFVLGFFWYGSMMFHRTWCRENGVPEDFQAGHPAKVFGISFMYAALAAGADALKLFPAEALPPPVLRAWRAVLPREVWLLPVGGIAPASMPPYLDAGANGFGLGSALFKPDMTVEAIAANARRFADAYRDWAGG